MEKIIIGSTATRHYFPDFPREPKDIDYAVKERITGSTREIEYLVNPVLFNYTDAEYLPPDMLYTLKVSHIFWDIFWEKNMWDIQWLLEKGCKLNKQLFDDLYEYWNGYHGKNHRSKLDMSADEFFDNAITCPVPHDDLHEMLKEVPTYTKVLKDGAEVDVSEDKFNALSFDEKRDLVMEEVMVMSFERKFHSNYKISYGRMLRKFIRNHAPMWEALWIIENFKKLYKPDFDYFTFLNNKINGTSSCN